MATRQWAEDSFWESYDKSRITTILTITDDEGKVTTQQLTVNRHAPNGEDNPDFKEIVHELTEEKITENTNTRNKQRAERRKIEEKRRQEKEKAEQLKNLFELKIQAFEIEAIKNSKNRALKSKLRKAQNTIEVNIYSMMIIMEEMNKNEQGTD